MNLFAHYLNFEHIKLDFLERLNLSHNKNNIKVFVNSLLANAPNLLILNVSHMKLTTETLFDENLISD